MTAAILVLCCVVSAWIYTSRVQMRRRLAQLKLAEELLRQHHDALMRFVDDAGAPKALKTLLLDLSDILDDREKALATFELMRVGGAGDEPPPEVALLRDLDARSPGLHQLFFAALGSGYAASLLRWDETARMIDEAAPRILADPNSPYSLIRSAGLPHSDLVPHRGLQKPLASAA